MNPLTEWHGNLPSHWPLVPLRYVAELGTGHTPDRTKPEYWVDCNIPWVTAADLSGRSSEFEPLMETAQQVSALGVANSAAVVHPAGTVMFCRTASVGLLTVIGRPMATTQAFVTWSPGPRLLSRYLLYSLAAMRSELFRIAYGSTHLTIYMPDLEALRIPVPPLEEQRRVVDFLDDQVVRLDRAIALRQHELTLVQERHRTRVQELTRGAGGPMRSVGGWLGMQRATWGLTTIGRLARIWAGSGFPPRLQGRPDGEVALLKVSDLSQADHRGIVSRSANYVSRTEASQLRAAIAPTGTVLFPKVGAALLTKNRAILAMPAAFDNNVMGLQFHRGSPAYWRSLLAGLDLGRLANPEPVPSINADQIRAVQVPDAPESDQLAIASLIDRENETIAAASSTLSHFIERAVERKLALITAAVTGQLDVRTARVVA